MAFQIEMIARSLADLPSILADQENGTLGEGEWIALSQEWGADMATLRVVVDPVYRVGQMTPSLEESYRRLLRGLEQALPVIDKLRFARPAMPLNVAA